MEEEPETQQEQISPIEKRLFFAQRELLPEIDEIIMSDWGMPLELIDPKDNTVKTDLEADEKAVEVIQAKYPHDKIVIEEFAKKGRIINPNGEYSWIMDLIDGSSNYRRQIPNFASSIAIGIDDVVTAGVVCSLIEKKIFYAARGNGTCMYDLAKGLHKSLKVSKTSRLESATVSTVSSNSYKKHGLLNILEWLHRGMKSCPQLGCTSLEFAYVASGAYDGIVKPTKNPWGVSAGLLLVEEAGGKVKSIKKGDLYIHVASNPFIHDELCRIVEAYLS